MKKTESKTNVSASQRINQQIADLADWHGKMLAQLRTPIQEADPAITGERK